MTTFEFWAIVIIGGSALLAMLIVALRMILGWRATSPVTRPHQPTPSAPDASAPAQRLRE